MLLSYRFTASLFQLATFDAARSKAMTNRLFSTPPFALSPE